MIDLATVRRELVAARRRVLELPPAVGVPGRTRLVQCSGCAQYGDWPLYLATPSLMAYACPPCADAWDRKLGVEAPTW
jgi:hypothetical protein